jgi:transposase
MSGLRWEARTVPNRIPQSSVSGLSRWSGLANYHRGHAELGLSQGFLHNWVKQDQVDRASGLACRPRNGRNLAAARRRIREQEAELEIVSRASVLFGEAAAHPKEVTWHSPAGR